MTSIHTNTAAMVATSTLSQVAAGLNRTQANVSSGLRVGSASDNAAYWSISTTMKSDNKALSAVSDSLALAQAVVDVAYSGMDQIKENFVAIRNLLISAMDAPPPATSNILNDNDDPIYEGTAVGKIDTEIRQRFEQIRSTVSSSSFAGINLLVNEAGQPANADDRSIEFVVGYSNGEVKTAGLKSSHTMMVNYARTSDVSAIVGPEYDFEPQYGYLDTPYALYWWKNIFNEYDGSKVVDNDEPYLLRDDEVGFSNDSGWDRTEQYQGLIQQFDARIQDIIGGMASVGAFLGNLHAMDDLVASQQETTDKGVGRLIDADMNEESARLKALQTQQQLGVQALSIANAHADNVLQLYR